MPQMPRMVSPPEFSRRLRLDALGTAPAERQLEANEAERAALARRFGLVSLDRLGAAFSIRRNAEGAEVSGTVRYSAGQACVVSGATVPAEGEVPLRLRYSATNPSGTAAAETELSADDLDVLPLEDGGIDLGEAAAQALATALDPYPRASEAVLADARQKLVSEEEAAEALARERARSGPFRVIDGGGR